MNAHIKVVINMYVIDESLKHKLTYTQKGGEFWPKGTQLEYTRTKI